MSYTALYRKFRPLNFTDMVGQDHITKTLKNQIIADRVGHAYLFSGGRGTGKTTTAKILARAVNCLNPKEGEPCNECEICKSIIDGSLTDVVEMDAASNNGVDDIRTIREEVNFLPTKAKYRIYIIDEVHMLSAGAFNALLKTLEEPPEHVKFFLATTEPQKLPATILSRCQRFDYKKIPTQDIIKRLKIICEGDKIKITEEALKTIAILSEGAMRDAISILERCAQEDVETIDEDKVKELVGIPKTEKVNKLVEAIFEKDETRALETISEVIDDGIDLYQYLWEIIKYIKDILIYKSSKKLLIYSKEEIEKIEVLSNKKEKEELIKMIYEFSNLENELKYSSQKTIMFQTGIIRACSMIENFSSMGEKNPDLEKKILKLEQEIQELKNLKSTIKTSQIEERPKEIKENIIEKEEKKISSKEIQKEEKPKVQNGQKGIWDNVLDTLKKSGKFRLYTCLANAKVEQVGDMILEISFPNGITTFNEGILSDVNNKNDLTKIVSNISGEQMHIKYKFNSSGEEKPNQNKKSLEELGVDINIID